MAFRQRDVLHKKLNWLSLTNFAMHLCKCNGVADLLKHALKGVGMNEYRRTPKIGER